MLTPLLLRRVVFAAQLCAVELQEQAANLEAEVTGLEAQLVHDDAATTTTDADESADQVDADKGSNEESKVLCCSKRTGPKHHACKIQERHAGRVCVGARSTS